MSKKRFCWVYGVGAWGVTTALMFAFVMSKSTGDSFAKWVSISLVMFPIGGYWWGSMMWKVLQRRPAKKS